MGGKLWTDEEIEFLEQHAGKMMIPTLAKRISEEFGNERTAKGVHTKLKRLGITNMLQETGRITAHELANLVGVDYRTMRRWIDKGLLTYVRRTVVYKTKHYLISAENFWEFAEKHKDRVNFLRIKPNSIIPEPEWVEGERKKEYYSVPKKQRKKWDAEEDNVLISMKKAGYSMKEISQRLKRSVTSVQSRKELLISQGRLPYDQILLRWTEEELETFYRLEEQGYTDKQIAYELGREEYHVCQKRLRLRKSGKYKGVKGKVS